MNDVCLLLEGTYPYVAGGVSTWVYDIIKRMRDTSFSIVYLGPQRTQDKKMRYDLPKNVTDFREFYVFDYLARAQKRPSKRESKQAYQTIKEFLQQIKKGDTSLFDTVIKLIGDSSTRAIDLHSFAHSYDAWKVLEEIYMQEADGLSFLDYFWTWRFVYLPFFSLININMPEAKLYQSVSTGYAGLLGALAKYQYNRPFLLTEHGIYTRERRIEISQADWIYSETADELKVTEGTDFFREWWIDLFSFFSKIAYDRSDAIMSLFEGSRSIQIAEGALPEKTRVIPNGVEIELLTSLERVNRKDGIFRIGFMGRVVPIKDVKTFIRACHVVYEEIKNIEIYIMGPTNEGEDYYRECMALVDMESLNDIVHFTGRIKVSDYYPKLDVIVLTSISEGQPIVILEASACGIPVVSSDVGSCSELLYGSQPDDRLLGPSGIITPICDPEATAQAIIRLLKDETLYEQMADSGRKRIVAYYQMSNLIASYRQLYSHYMEELRWQE